MITLFHGTGSIFTAHEGQCWTADQDIAERYARNGAKKVFAVEIDLDTLVVEEVEVSQERVDAQNWPGDKTSERNLYRAKGIDVLYYEDMTPNGVTHMTYRVISDRAVVLLASAFEVELETDEDDE